jgi:hypothetical protein
VRSKRFTIASLAIDGVELPLKYGDLLVAASPGATHIDWECVVMPFDPAPIDQGAYRVAAVTLEGRRLQGDAVLVRSVSGTHILRGAGTLDGITEDEIDE